MGRPNQSLARPNTRRKQGPLGKQKYTLFSWPRVDLTICFVDPHFVIRDTRYVFVILASARSTVFDCGRRQRQTTLRRVHLSWEDLYVLLVVVVVVVFTLTDRASTIPSNIRGCQSGTWSQRGTKVNGSHHGDNPLLRPTGIQIATKVMRLYKRWHRPITKRFIKRPLLHIIESSLDRLGLLSPTHDQRSQQQIGQTRSNQF